MTSAKMCVNCNVIYSPDIHNSCPICMNITTSREIKINQEVKNGID